MTDEPHPEGADDPRAMLPDADLLPLLRSTALFTGVPAEELQAIAARLSRERFAAGETILREGEVGDTCYLIRRGRAGVVSRDLIGQEVTLATFGPGAHFGEVALVTQGKRTATVRALEAVDVYVLSRADFVRLEQTCPAFATHVRQQVHLLTVDAFLRKASPFAHLPAATIRRLAGQVRSERVHGGDIVIHEGEEGNRWYLVRQGRVEVLKGGRRVQVLEAGDGFGEVALLAAVQRTATVRALEATELLSLPKADFMAIVEEHPALRGQFREFIRIRVGASLAQTVVAADPRATLMPHLAGGRRRYWWLLLGGIAAFVVLSVLATRTQAPAIMYAVLIVGSFIGPVVYVTNLADAHLLPDRPLRLAVTFVLAAALGIPLAYVIETWLGVRHGVLGSSLLIGVIEELAKVVGVVWLLRRATARFQMDGVVYGAAAGMGFAAFENVLYGLARVHAVSELLSALWLRTLLAPFGHGTWTAIICAALWRQKGGSASRWGLRTGGAFALSVGLHTLWNWQPVTGFWLVVWLVVIGLVGLEALRAMIEGATREAAAAVVALNPEVAQARGAAAVQATCRGCGQVSPPGTHYCVRCGAALRQELPRR
ncbi:MAG: cyclic nucleotide-binding domain-containing protein [Chloroflexi bacterium]|nr:cyclic nucleotide-binding domain-containing protein [Chloroflexota bacterium]